MRSSLVLLFVLMLLAGSLNAQKKLVLLKGSNVIAQFSEGQYIRLKLRNGKKTEGHILELYPFSMITSSDTIQFQNIKRIDIRKQRGGISVTSGIGGFLFLGGILYIGLDRLNSGYSTSRDLDPSVWHTSVIMTSVGAAMIFIRPKYVRVNYKVHVRTVDYGSTFYQN